MGMIQDYLDTYIFHNQWFAVSVTYAPYAGGSSSIKAEIIHESGNTHGADTVGALDYQLGLSDYQKFRIKYTDVNQPAYRDSITYKSQSWKVKDFRLNRLVWEISAVSALTQRVQVSGF